MRYALAVAMVVSAGVLAAPVRAAEPPANLYLALGDSVSAGTGVAPGKGFVDLYYSYLRDPARGRVNELQNLAIPGETSSSMLIAEGQLDDATAALNSPSDTKVVTLDIGANDGFSGQCPGGFNADPCPFKGNYSAIMQSLESGLADDPGEETLQVMQYYNPATGTGGSDEGLFDFGLLGDDGRIDCSATGAALGLNDLAGCIGAAHGAVAVDVYPTFKAGGPSLIVDGIHPTETGHAYIACLFEHPERAGSAKPCEPPPPTPSGPTTPSGAPVGVPDAKAPRAVLSGPARQQVLRRGGLVLFVSTDEDVTLSASAKIAIPLPRHRTRSAARAKVIRVGPLSRRVRANTRTRLKLELSRKHLRLVGRALQGRRSLTAGVKVRVTDAAGNTRAVTMTIKIVS